MEYLRRHRHNLELPDPKDGYSCLHAACLGDHPEIVKTLLYDNVDVNYQSTKPPNVGQTALWVAAFLGHSECVEALVKSTLLDLNLRDEKNNMSAEMIAREYGHKKTADLIAAEAGRRWSTKQRHAREKKERADEVARQRADFERRIKYGR